MSEDMGSRKARKRGSPENSRKSKGESPKSEQENDSASSSYRDNIPNSDIENKYELNKSDPDSFRDENPTSEIKTMEVHHHPEVEKKGFKEYLLEGLMIFLAVTMGFYAESYREYLGDRGKEKEYMQSMVSDLQKDTAFLNRSIKNIKFVIKGHDSLENMLENPGTSREFYRKLYYMNTAFTWYDIEMRFAESTFSELKSSGNLRLIQNNALKDSILKYENAKSECALQHAYTKESISRTYFFATDIFDISCYRKYNDFLNNADFANSVFVPYEKVKQYISESPRLFTNNLTVLKKYSRLVNNEKAQIADDLVNDELAKKIAMRLMKAIKMEYNFE